MITGLSVDIRIWKKKIAYSWMQKQFRCLLEEPFWLMGCLTLKLKLKKKLKTTAICSTSFSYNEIDRQGRVDF